MKRDFPIDRLKEEAMINLKHGITSVWLQLDEILLYGCDNSELRPNKDAVINLFSEIKSLPNVNYVGAVHIVGSTIANNAAAYPGAGISGGGYTEVVNTLIAGNGTGNCAAPVVSLGNNLDSDGSCGLRSAGDLSHVDPLLAPLDDNGGPAPTHA